MTTSAAPTETLEPVRAGWRPTPAHTRASVVGLGLVVFGVLVRRPELLVLGTPLALVSLWSVVLRPDRDPSVVAGPRHLTLREGQATRWVAEVGAVPGAEDVGLALMGTEHTEYDPPSRAVAGTLETAGEPVSLAVACRSLRWGRRHLGPAVFSVSGPFGGFRWAPDVVLSPPVTTVPLPDHFDARVPVPRPDGLVGQNRSNHPGDGGEFADIRQFRFGDRLRRVHWPVSVRTGQLHVTATHADQDSEVILLVDAMHDIGVSQGVSGRSSSLDNAVRAAGAIAEHYLRTGDRVGLHVLGAREVAPLDSAAGRNHLRRVLDTLARTRSGNGTVADEKRLRTQLRHRVPTGALVIVLTPAISREVLGHAIALSRRGLSVVVVDTLPPELREDDVDPSVLETVLPEATRSPLSSSLAWRLRLLERSHEMLRAREAGVPIVPWAGPGTLDLVLRDLGRRSRAPRVVSR
ncbi:MAG TPA: DUF58 domain-containing protein [Pedococcus sp.]|nr:DUF58 domain-containing protein [Pedococcus sp.]